MAHACINRTCFCEYSRADDGWETGCLGGHRAWAEVGAAVRFLETAGAVHFSIGLVDLCNISAVYLLQTYCLCEEDEMPAIRPLSDFTRNQASIIDSLAETKEPIYLTRNGSACVVVMDAAAFDEAMDFRNELREQEMRTYCGIMRGIEEFSEGDFIDADEADRLIRAEKGWL